MFQKINCRCSKELPRILSILRRYKYNKSIHWTKYEKRDFPRYKALAHFDDFYKNVYGPDLWRSLRLGLLCNNKYCAIVNNFSERDEIMENLQNRGALNMRDLFEIHEEKLKEQSFTETRKVNPEEVTLDEKLDVAYSSLERQNRLSETYSKYKYVDVIEEHTKDARPEEPVKEEESPEYVGKLSLQEGLKDAHLDHNRIIHLKHGLSTASLYEFVPASKIKGIDKMLTESSHLEYYKRAVDFPINIEKETTLNFPENLNVYTYEKCNVTSFPHPERGRTGVFDFYLLDGGSILPILALDLNLGDRLLDMCGAPGGKSITAFQTLLLDKLVCNDINKGRVERIKKVMSEYLYNSNERDKFIVTQEDALRMREHNKYNKILVDVPCTNDRLSVIKDEGNWFKGNRMGERLRLPEVQCDLLVKALQLVESGGTVVYSTCSLSPIQNDGVVQMALKKIWEEQDSEFIVKDMAEALKPAEIVYCLDHTASSKYGTVVLPKLTANFGPLYFSKLVKI